MLATAIHSVFYDRLSGGYYLDFAVDRLKAARYGLTVGEVQDVIGTMLGGKPITWSIEGRERYFRDPALSQRALRRGRDACRLRVCGRRRAV